MFAKANPVVPTVNNSPKINFLIMFIFYFVKHSKPKKHYLIKYKNLLRFCCDFTQIFNLYKKNATSMEKTKLKEYREIKGFSQKLLAEKLCIDVSNYARREKGVARISNNEWIKLSEILEVP